MSLEQKDQWNYDSHLLTSYTIEIFRVLAFYFLDFWNSSTFLPDHWTFEIYFLCQNFSIKLSALNKCANCHPFAYRERSILSDFKEAIVYLRFRQVELLKYLEFLDFQVRAENAGHSSFVFSEPPGFCLYLFTGVLVIEPNWTISPFSRQIGQYCHTIDPIFVGSGFCIETDTSFFWFLRMTFSFFVYKTRTEKGLGFLFRKCLWN